MTSGGAGPVYRPLPPGKSSRTVRAAHLVVAFVETFAIGLIVWVVVSAYRLNMEPPAPELLPGLAFMLVSVVVTTIVVGLLARNCLVRDHVEVTRVRQLYPVAMSVFCLAVVLALACWGIALFGTGLLRAYLGGDFFASSVAGVANLTMILAGLCAARLHGLRKL